MFILSEIDQVLHFDSKTNTILDKDGSVPCALIKAILLPGADISPYYHHNVGTSKAPRKIHCLCSTCAKYNLNRVCKHMDKNKYIIITTTLHDLNYSMKFKKYKLIQMCELYLYEKKAQIFQNYINAVEGLKMEYDSKNKELSKFLKNGLNSR